MRPTQVGAAAPSPRDQNARQVPFQTCKRKFETEKNLARQTMRRNRPRRRVEQKERRARLEEAKARSRNSELQVATYNVRTLSLTGKHGAGHAEVVLRKCQTVGCDVIGLHRRRRDRAELSFLRQGIVSSAAGLRGTREGLDNMGLDWQSRSRLSAKRRGLRHSSASASCR